ncbi:uncharacterized protein BDZ99DRAFT_568139 [Mytilinidion resinicola]|uniref:Uncharacterized protein n=1 Tax=Mytilinidion resinicola TaxID=574789 RepID=A0A6A6YV33_9PEZI|nr:uncharacterized protein BDZ99DRAFT_568139 [Mytilinidion resinicola]KAF2812816.1 hypothetical protein BDZ99DRAFT_568139 [Mytilinidion resinicola]
MDYILAAAASNPAAEVTKSTSMKYIMEHVLRNSTTEADNLTAETPTPYCYVCDKRSNFLRNLFLREQYTMNYMHCLETVVANHKTEMSEIHQQRQDEEEALQSMEKRFNDVKKQRDCIAAVSSRLGSMFDDLMKAEGNGDIDKAFTDTFGISDLVGENEQRRVRVRELEAALIEKELELDYYRKEQEPTSGKWHFNL